MTDKKGPVRRVPHEIFREAYHEFRNSLTEKDKALFKEFSGAKSMLTTIKEDAKSHPVYSSTLTKCCKGINSIANRLSPFFDIAGLFVSSHPEFAALAWGSLRLVFILGSNHAKFLERVCDMFESMNVVLPAYEEYVSKLRSRLTANGHECCTRIFKTLAYIQADLIQFCFEMCKLFTRKRSNSLLISHNSWIDPPTWAYAFENSQHRRSERTTGWFLKHHKVSRWLSQVTPERTLSALSVQAMAALRAILTQLLHIFRKDDAIVDIITLLWDQNKSGQVTASTSEIVSALYLLSSRVSRLFMAIDWADEYQDHEDLFDYLKEISQYSNSVFVALFSRPTLAIPQDLSSMLEHLDLTSTMNFESLETFLRPKIQPLARDGVISSEDNRDQIVTLLASRANGMFLWAQLLVEYLLSPKLSIRQRRAVDKYDTIPNFEKALSQMSGALIELDSDRKARFVHFSVLEYLTDRSFQDQSQESVSNFVKEQSLAQRSCASCCLAYLLYSIPAEPLGGGPQVVADCDLQKIRYPFLKYSAQYWDFHFSEFLLTGGTGQNHGPRAFYELPAKRATVFELPTKL
ncbi:uncharacterized protein FFUJ_09997 [Fusarium fujikuroi IMI 58289]|uniref:DUF7708 domain-containing protein n=1 Tax=Gibberella fujikuroi (strain CBS 195.34 / IMI 58289 / NRRL A-6831) TaxID=1279085 RepID=S0ELP9_GIBF5|nr:uncharacterized protein FFUJ_09997 [Fusarium fujikuroi IMI 58289]CCT73318.1 uncharacterized protein FFUJ_09997 [Fusarium fujikuroi IMI 58289]SCO16646.1 uncharacterized protein FFM5_11333 [Fusarium fujikuroi]